jgi:hypothetical protein
VKMSPELPSRLWSKLDIVPMVFKLGLKILGDPPDTRTIDEDTDSMARKCLMLFGPTQQPRIQVGYKRTPLIGLEKQLDSDGPDSERRSSSKILDFVRKSSAELRQA